MQIPDFTVKYVVEDECDACSNIFHTGMIYLFICFTHWISVTFSRLKLSKSADSLKNVRRWCDHVSGSTVDHQQGTEGVQHNGNPGAKKHRFLLVNPNPQGGFFFPFLGIVHFSRQKGNPLKLEGYPFLSLGAKTNNPLKVDRLLFSLFIFPVLRRTRNLLSVWCWVCPPDGHLGIWEGVQMMDWVHKWTNWKARLQRKESDRGKKRNKHNARETEKKRGERDLHNLHIHKKVRK